MQRPSDGSARIDLLDGSIRPYAWGSRTAIPELLGVPATGDPQAELWLGAHPGAPSRVRRDGRVQPLPELIDADPQGQLGQAVTDELGPRLPFLLKVIAAEKPLSLQAHPSAEQAREGFEDENERGVPLDSPSRNYSDPFPKPELVRALTPFEALCGFRPLAGTIRLLELLGERSRRAERGTTAALAADVLESYVAALRARPDRYGLREVVTRILTLPAERRARLVEPTAAVCRMLAAEGGAEFGAEVDTAVLLAETFPGDIGVVISLLMNRITLQPGEGVYLPAGNLHAYLRGTGVELMVNSDNVLRGGLTPKHVDVAELLRVLDVDPRPAVPVPMRQDGAECVYEVPVREFRLSTLALTGSEPVPLAADGPQILLATEGTAGVADAAGDTVPLERGSSVWVPAGAGQVSVSGTGTVFRATTNLVVDPLAGADADLAAAAPDAVGR